MPKRILAILALVTLVPLANAADPLRRYGPDLVDSDWALVRAAAEKLYLTEAVENGATEAWSNPKSGNQGTVTLVGKHEFQDMPCRRLQHDITVKRTPDRYRFVVDRCRTPEGEWKIAPP